ncbi:MAG TPA: helix-turn-helix transcriptional regulator [Abditibacteriaceae bacterium]|jgi:MerR family transcriptional regulator/heat shock protein HspR
MKNKKPSEAQGQWHDGQTLYHISIVAEMVTTHPQTLRMYERLGLVSPQRTSNNVRLYSSEDIERVRRIQHLTQDLGVNLAGVEVVFKLLNELERTRAESEAILDAMEKSHAEGWSRAELRRRLDERAPSDSGNAIVPLYMPLGEGKKTPARKRR